MTTIEVRDESEKLVAEQALLAFRASKRAAFVAPMGHGLEVAEQAVLCGLRYTGLWERFWGAAAA